PDPQRKLVVELAIYDFVSSLNDQLCLFWRQELQVLVNDRGGFFENAKCPNQLFRHQIVAYGKVVQGPLCLSSPVAVGGSLDLPHAIALGSELWLIPRHCFTHWILRSNI